MQDPKFKLNSFTTKKKQKKKEKMPCRYIIEASSGNQIIEIQLQLLVTLYCFEEVLLTYLIVA